MERSTNTGSPPQNDPHYTPDCRETVKKKCAKQVKAERKRTHAKTQRRKEEEEEEEEEKGKGKGKRKRKRINGTLLRVDERLCAITRAPRVVHTSAAKAALGRPSG